MNKLTGTILTLPKMSGNVGAKTIYIGDKGDDGATFTPSVSADGIISWTNDKGLPNPEPANIKGPPGVPGATPVKGVDYFDGTPGASATHRWDGTTLTITSASGTSSANLKGDPGKDGAPGYTPVKGVDYFDGKDGYTPVKGVDYFDGEPGKDGEPGQPGKDGYTPVKGKDYFDGQPGKDGVSVTHAWNGTTLTVTSASGTSSADLKGEKGNPGNNGLTAYQIAQKDGFEGTEAEWLASLQGKPGPPGATPVKGKDYFTADDKAEMVNAVKNALPTLTVTGIDADGGSHSWTMYGVAQ